MEVLSRRLRALEVNDIKDPGSHYRGIPTATDRIGGIGDRHPRALSGITERSFGRQADTIASRNITIGVAI